VLKAFGDWHAPIEAFMALAKCLRDIAQLMCRCCSGCTPWGKKRLNCCHKLVSSWVFFSETGLYAVLSHRYRPAGESRGQSRRLNAGLVLAGLTDDCFGSIKESQGKEMKAHDGLCVKPPNWVRGEGDRHGA